MAIIALYSCSKKMTPTPTKAEPVVTNQETPAKVAPQEHKVRTPLTTAPETNVDTDKQVLMAESKPPLKETALVESGKIVYKTKCGRCHDFKDPQSYDAARWVKIIDWMAPKAQLNATEKEHVLAYVNFYAKK